MAPRTRLALFVVLLVVTGIGAWTTGRLLDPPLPPGVVLDVHHG
jgi:hypothetical protein